MIKKGLYAIIDSLANDTVGGVHIHQHEATAVRFFSDVAGLQGSQIALHPTDYNLVRLGYINHDFALTAEYVVVMTGEQWLASQPKQEG